jgi:glycosyltransferase involved in cell wall biosynthesis
MRLTILTHYYPPEAGAPQTRLSALAARLSDLEVDVTVHTCAPHYPSGRVHAGYPNRPWAHGAENGVPVVRSLVLPAANRGTVLRLADHASFAASAVATASRSGPADAILAESPPLFLAGAAVAYARVKRARLVLNVADLWPDSAVELGAIREGAAAGLARRLEGFAYRHADAITAPTEGIVATLGARTDAAGKVHRLGPLVDRDRFDVGPVEAAAGPLRVLYAGTLGLAQGLGTLLDAAHELGGDIVQVRAIGGGAQADELRARVAAEGISNVDLRGVVPGEEVPGHYRWAHAAAVLLRDRPIFEAALPTKLLEAMAARRPVLLCARGEAAKLVERAGAGAVVAPDDGHALAVAIRELASTPIEDMRERGESAREAVGQFGVDRAAATLADLLADLPR